MKTYPDAMILDWQQFTGGTVNWYIHEKQVKQKRGIRGWAARNGPWHGGNLREAVSADITEARKSDRRCICAFRRTTRGSVWVEHLTPL